MQLTYRGARLYHQQPIDRDHRHRLDRQFSGRTLPNQVNKNRAFPKTKATTELPNG